MILYVIDDTPRSGMSAAARILGRFMPVAGPEATVFVVGPGSGNLRQIATAAAAACAGRNASLVRFVAHGDSGRLYLGTNTLTAGTAFEFFPLRGAIVRRGAGSAGRYPFSQHVGVEIHGCGVASSQDLRPERFLGGAGTGDARPGALQGGWGDVAQVDSTGTRLSPSASAALRALPGIALVQSLANIFGTGVVAGVDAQSPDAGWAMEGPTVTMFPLPGDGVLHDPAGTALRPPTAPGSADPAGFSDQTRGPAGDFQF